jgi:hypothetical protein
MGDLKMMNSVIRRLVLTLILALTTNSAWATPAQVLIIRHAEKPDSGPDLSPDGYERAQLLVNYFETNPNVTEYGTPVAIYAMRPDKSALSSNRPVETVTPLAQALGLQIQEKYVRKQTAELVQDILSNPAYEGKMVLICWEHHAISDIVANFGVDPLPAAWPDDDFGSVWEINFSGDQISSFKQFSEHLMPDDGSSD